MRTLFYTIFIISLTLFTSPVFSQITGEQFAPDRSHWSEYGLYRVSSQSMIPVYENILISGDTLINNRYCQKIYSSKSLFFDSTCMQFAGYMYYNNRKLYIDTTTNIDTTSSLIYDFSLNENDSFSFFIHNIGNNGYYKIPVDYCDSMYYGGYWRKRIVFEQVSGLNFCGPITWVEGIGDIDHGLSSKLFSNAPTINGFFGGAENYYGAINQCCRNGGFVFLNCFQMAGFNSIGRDCTPSSCITSIDDEENDNEINFVISNPVVNKLIIQFPTPISSQLFIFNNIGQVVRTEIIQNSYEEFDLSDLQGGVYFLRLQLRNSVLTKKIIIQH